MTNGRYSRRNASFRPTGVRRSDRENNFFLAIVGFSLLSHIIVAALFLYTPATTSKRRPPTLYVDLVMAPPVVNPQRGSAGATVKTAAPAVTIPQPTVAAPKVAKAPVVVEKKETKKAAVVKDDVDIAADIARMKQRKEAQDTQAAIAAMRKKTTSTPPTPAAVGSASGTGDEAGSAIGEWLQQAVKEKWTWTDRKRKDLSAEIEVNFASNGKIIGYRFKRSSGDVRFDKSLTDA
ncbi:MAG: TonB C-terminal domain-containing protein, partial [Desulfuromonadales bacterium]|nr:TonB C-terminal domain-containing protein [Desulfuromonadales bacterium]